MGLQGCSSFGADHGCARSGTGTGTLAWNGGRHNIPQAGVTP